MHAWRLLLLLLLLLLCVAAMWHNVRCHICAIHLASAAIPPLIFLRCDTFAAMP
jgi:hypothetical protein